jgi:hypothetical protein
MIFYVDLFVNAVCVDSQGISLMEGFRSFILYAASQNTAYVVLQVAQ